MLKELVRSSSVPGDATLCLFKLFKPAGPMGAALLNCPPGGGEMPLLLAPKRLPLISGTMSGEGGPDKSTTGEEAEELSVSFGDEVRADDGG